MKSKIQDNNLIIELQGRIDTGNAAQIESEVMDLLSSETYEAVVIDADDLAYISSAGLRVILKIKKTCKALTVINASTEVYDIFEMTGFTEIIDVSKGFRKISLDGCELIGSGANGKVYRFDPETIIKVYAASCGLDDIKRERELARRAFVLGINTAIPYDIVRVGDSYGSVFELLNSTPFAKKLAEHPETFDECLRQSVELLKTIHSTETLPDDMPDMKKVALEWAAFLKEYLPEETAEKLYSLIENVPDDYHIIHGDYHIKNVMEQNGEPILIDMDTLAHGNPIFEFGSIYNAYIGFNEPAGYGNQKFLGIPPEMAVKFWKRTIEEYFGTQDPEKLEEIENKSKLMGYTRLMRRLIRRSGLEDPVKKVQVDFYKENIIKLADKIDSLAF